MKTDTQRRWMNLKTNIDILAVPEFFTPYGEGEDKMVPSSISLFSILFIFLGGSS